MRIAVIGAGLAGLTAARTLSKAAHEVTVFDKSRGLGGRLATRRTEAGGIDHGAPWLNAGGDFADVLSGLAEAGAAARHDDAWVGLPGMSGLVRPLADGLDIRTGGRGLGARRRGGHVRRGGHASRTVRPNRPCDPGTAGAGADRVRGAGRGRDGAGLDAARGVRRTTRSAGCRPPRDGTGGTRAPRRGEAGAQWRNLGSAHASRVDPREPRTQPRGDHARPLGFSRRAHGPCAAAPDLPRCPPLAVRADAASPLRALSLAGGGAASGRGRLGAGARRGTCLAKRSERWRTR